MVLTVELGFRSRAAGRDVDCGEDSGLSQRPVEHQLAVARSLEFLEDELIHSRAGVDQARGYDGDRASIFNVARQPEQTAGHFEDAGFESAATSVAGRRAAPAGPSV